MTYRRPPRTLPEKLAQLEEDVRRLQAVAATQPVITDYTALSGTPTDNATIADVQAVADALGGVELLLWLGGPT